jgi:hypothetical protein
VIKIASANADAIKKAYDMIYSIVAEVIDPSTEEPAPSSRWAGRPIPTPPSPPPRRRCRASCIPTRPSGWRW